MVTTPAARDSEAIPDPSPEEAIVHQNQPTPASSAGPVHKRQLEKSVSWSRGERFRFLWYRLRLTVAEMNYATRRLYELQARPGR
jgi:hypothetical protein